MPHSYDIGRAVRSIYIYTYIIYIHESINVFSVFARLHFRLPLAGLCTQLFYVSYRERCLIGATILSPWPTMTDSERFMCVCVCGWGILLDGGRSHDLSAASLWRYLLFIFDYEFVYWVFFFYFLFPCCYYLNGNQLRDPYNGEVHTLAINSKLRITRNCFVS